MRNVLIIAYGNTLRGDDGIAWRALEELERGGVPPRVSIIKAHQLDPELSGAIAKSDLVVFVDATREGTPGEVRSRDVASDAPDSDLTHQMSPAALLALTRSLYGAAVAGKEITMCGESFELGERLSLTCGNALPQLVGRIAAAVKTGVPMPTDTHIA